MFLKYIHHLLAKEPSQTLAWHSHVRLRANIIFTTFCVCRVEALLPVIFWICDIPRLWHQKNNDALAKGLMFALPANPRVMLIRLAV